MLNFPKIANSTNLISILLSLANRSLPSRSHVHLCELCSLCAEAWWQSQAGLSNLFVTWRGDGSKIRKKNTRTHKQVHEPRCPGGWKHRLERWVKAKNVMSETSSSPWKGASVPLWLAVWGCFRLEPEMGTTRLCCPKVAGEFWNSFESRLRQSYLACVLHEVQSSPFTLKTNTCFQEKSYITPPPAPVCRTGQYKDFSFWLENKC